MEMPRLGREKAIMDENRELWVYFQYEKVQAICFRCGVIGHVLKRCPDPHLPLDLEARNEWIGDSLRLLYFLSP
ncbi:hypothetical protein LINPERPRIM_LOCUS30368 [Linum perenne]